MRHEEATDSAQPIAEDERPRGLNALSFTNLPIPEINYSLDSTELTRRVMALQRHNDQIANHLQGIPQREEYDALLAQVTRMDRELDALVELHQEQANTIRDLLTIVRQKVAA